MVYRCERCGAEYETDDPPCAECGHQWYEEVTAVVESTGGIVWVCTECGRSHTKNSPPCSRCGNHTFEKRDQDYDLGGTSAPGYLDLASPKYLLAAVGALAVLGLFLLVAFGVVPLPELLGGKPTVSNVPGEAASVAGISLTEVEREVVANLSERREAAGRESLTEDDRIGELATYYNQKRAKADYAGGERPQTEGLPGRFDVRCSRPLALVTVPNGGSRLDVETAGSAVELGRALATRFAASDAVLSAERQRLGVDVHVLPDGTVYATLVVC